MRFFFVTELETKCVNRVCGFVDGNDDAGAIFFIIALTGYVCRSGKKKYTCQNTWAHDETAKMQTCRDLNIQWNIVASVCAYI